MKTYGGCEYKSHTFLTSALAGGEWSASRPGRHISYYYYYYYSYYYYYYYYY
jgi:hypothetical protein